MPLMETLQRAFAFARHIPPRRIVRRVELGLKRRLRDRLPTGAARPFSASRAETVTSPPLPIFAPRQGLLGEVDGRLEFRFIGRSIAMPGGAVNWSAPGPGAVHQLWRMNLHYMEYLESADDALFARLVEDWIAGNPARRPGAWRDSHNSYALSLRVVVWMQQLARRSGRLPARLVDDMHESLAAQLRFLERNLETDLGGNHLIKNIKALLWASAYFTGQDAQSWRTLALTLLKTELAAQILADGMHEERSPSYHAQVFSDLLECRHALGHDPLNGALDDTLARMGQALADMTHPDGGPALFNDAGLTMAYAPGQCLAAYAALSGQTPQPRRVFALEQAGYFGTRRDGTYLIADCGRIAPDDLPAHGHGDVLSFEWSVKGQRIIVDQGVFEYIAGDRRQRARAASSHNTLSLEGADQADFFGAFRCGRRPNVAVRHFEPGPDGFVLEGSHDGYAHLPGRPVHVRRFEACATKLAVTDRIEGRTDRRARIGFLLHPAVTVTLEGNVAHLACPCAIVRVEASALLRTEAAVWWPDMGCEQRTTRLVVDMPDGTNQSLVTFHIAQKRG